MLRTNRNAQRIKYNQETINCQHRVYEASRGDAILYYRGLRSMFDGSRNPRISTSSLARTRVCLCVIYRWLSVWFVIRFREKFVARCVCVIGCRSQNRSTPLSDRTPHHRIVRSRLQSVCVAAVFCVLLTANLRTVRSIHPRQRLTKNNLKKYLNQKKRSASRVWNYLLDTRSNEGVRSNTGQLPSKHTNIHQTRKSN